MKMFIQSIVYFILSVFAVTIDFGETAFGDAIEYSCRYKDKKSGASFSTLPACAAYTGESTHASQLYTNRCRVENCSVKTAEEHCPSASVANPTTAAGIKSKADCVSFLAKAKRTRALAMTSDRLLTLVEEKEAAGEARTLAEQTLKVESLRLQNKALVQEYETLSGRLNALKSTYLPSYQQYMKESVQRQNTLLSSIDQNNPKSFTEALDQLLEIKNERVLTNAMIRGEVDETRKRAVDFCGSVSYDPFLAQIGVNTDNAKAKITHFCDMALRRLEKRSNELVGIDLEIQGTYEIIYNQLLAKRSMLQKQIASEELKQKVGNAMHLSAVNRFLTEIEGSYNEYKEAEPQQGIPPLGYSEFIKRTRSFLSYARFCDNPANLPNYMEAGCNRFNEKREAVSSRNSRMARLMTLSLETIIPKISPKFRPLGDKAQQAIDKGNLSAAAPLVDFLIDDSKANGGVQ